ncbi:MAG: arylsulfotransferase family protein [Candidatus Woesearchaeota archaeon]|nr:arylsulfotransferase family protein [Candidatus Woesearchaeota archaeon]
MKTKISLIAGLAAVLCLYALIDHLSASTYLADNIISLPYLQYGTEKAKDKEMGITLDIKNESYPGYLIYDGILVDTDGNQYTSIMDYMLPNNLNAYTHDLLRLYKDDRTRSVDKEYYIHHERAYLKNKNLLFITKEFRNISGKIILFDKIMELDANGEIAFEWSTLDMQNELNTLIGNLPENTTFLNYGEINVSDQIKKILDLPIGQDYYDYYHLNAVSEIIGSPYPGDKRFRDGNLLISLRNIDTILVIDKKTKEIVWHYGPGILLKQHAPIMLENGNILVFDNGDNTRNHSRVIELDPISKKIIWEYGSKSDEMFYSEYRGDAQRLPNGNTLIADGNHGRVFEVTKEGKKVYEFFTPKLNADGHRENIYRAYKIEKNILNDIQR